MSNQVPMAWAAQMLAQVCDEIDNAEKIEEFLDQAFSDAKTALLDSVDRRIAFDRWVKIQVSAMEEGYRYYRARKELLEQVHARFKEKTKEIMEATPDLVDAFRGKLGKISLCDSPPAVEYAFGQTKEITPEIAQAFGIPDHYLKSKVVWSVDSERVKAELLAGTELGWASIRQAKHVRFPAVRKPKERQAAIEGVEE